jgi:chromosome segregation ATPase
MTPAGRTEPASSERRAGDPEVAELRELARRLEEEITRLERELALARDALGTTEKELFELRDRRSRTMAQLERKAYWLERAEIDPEAWMRRKPLRFAFRAFRFLLRARRRLSRGR